ncbi:DUF732 domain-containing protein [Williamsia deligens]|uniref:DUF732 domain-containing protein n=1 Tax=Williamsia deligens TaxID=321325 RepID=A0ABW3G314_9NOCA|nr:DUF732 domain-containing protein [Williamsia deligens]MCP2194221.1 Protein of unknown function (DUF732) [Williamsia deligens]
MKKLVFAAIAAGALVLAGCSDSDSNTPNASGGGAESASRGADSIGSAASSAADAVGGAASGARDAAFIGALGVGNLKFGSDDDMKSEARDVCSSLGDGKSAADAGNDVKDKYNGDDSKAKGFVRAAVTAYCPTEVGKLIY